MRRFGLLAVFLFSLSSAMGQEGEKLFQKASEYVFSARKINFVLTTQVKGKTYQNKGFIVSLPERGYLKIEGVSEFQYTPSLISYYNQSANEIVIQPRKSSSTSISENPFSILSRSDKGVDVTAPKETTLNGKKVRVITVTPKGKAYYKTADIYVVKASDAGAAGNVKVERIEVTLKNGGTYTIHITSAGSPEPEKVSDYQLLPSNYPTAQLTDLR